MNLSDVDLNLLRVLHAVLEKKSVAGAASTLHVTSPAVSNALARLRRELGDPLFVRQGRGLTPTPRALELAPILQRVFAELDAALHRGAFDPDLCTRVLTLALSDADQLTSLAPIARAFTARLPRASLRIVTLDTLVSGGGLGAGHVDLTMGPRFEQEGLYTRSLFREEGVFVVRRDHPRVRRTLTRKLFNGERHVDIHLLLGGPGAGNRVVVDALAAGGLVRQVGAIVPTFAAAASVVASTDLVGGLPRRVAELYARALGLRIVDGPMPPVSFEMCLHWHERTHRDPAVGAFRAAVIEALASRP
jgi:DNA-binding transcriptional LysR family regulator